MATHSSILAWRIPWTERPGRLQSTGSQRVRHDWATRRKGIQPSNVISSFRRFRWSREGFCWGVQPTWAVGPSAHKDPRRRRLHRTRSFATWVTGKRLRVSKTGVLQGLLWLQSKKRQLILEALGEGLSQYWQDYHTTVIYAIDHTYSMHKIHVLDFIYMWASLVVQS